MKITLIGSGISVPHHQQLALAQAERDAATNALAKLDAALSLLPPPCEGRTALSESLAQLRAYRLTLSRSRQRKYDRAVAQAKMAYKAGKTGNEPLAATMHGEVIP